MIRILQVVNNMHRAGLETMLMNYYRHVDRSKIQFDFLTHRPDHDDYDDEIERLGGKVYHAPRLYPQNYSDYFKYMRRFFAEHPEYQIMHSHIDTMSYLPLLAGKKAGIPIRIAHSHNTAIDRDFKIPLKMYYRSRISSVANYFCACGEEAGKFLFPGKEYMIIPNAIEVDKFLYQEDVRAKKRRELGITNENVVGHVGRFSYQKNHVFLINVFHELYKIDPSVKLILVGVGEKEQEIRKLVNEKSLANRVLFLGNRNDVNELYQAMDIFVMPSYFEGIPVVGVEAQFANLPCVFSNKVPREVRFTEKCKFIGLEKSPHEWASIIIKMMAEKQKPERNPMLENSHYNIKIGYKILEDMYSDLYKEQDGGETVGRKYFINR